MKKYDSKFYKKLPLSVRQSIFDGAMSLAAGFLAFDSTNVAGTGGGPAALLGRLGALEIAESWILKIATDMALGVQLTTIEEGILEDNTEAGSGDNNTDQGAGSGDQQVSDEEANFIKAENKHNAENSSLVQQIQIVNESIVVTDLSAKLDEIIDKLN